MTWIEHGGWQVEVPKSRTPPLGFNPGFPVADDMDWPMDETVDVDGALSAVKMFVDLWRKK